MQLNWETVKDLAEPVGDLSLSGRRIQALAQLALGLGARVRELEERVWKHDATDDQEPMHMGMPKDE